MRNEINIIIFSKNRACQLELLLRTLTLEATVLYFHDPEYEESYHKVFKTYSSNTYIKETNFQSQILELLTGKYVMFLCDDDIQINPFNCGNLDEIFSNSQLLTLSTRLCRRYNYNMIRRVRCRVPDSNLFKWSEYSGDWAYPMSVSSNIFRVEDIRDILRLITFNSPNTLEKNMRRYIPDRPLMMCVDEPIFINNLANRVQTQFNNPNLGISPEYLNEQFMKGLSIDSQDIIKKAKQSHSCFLKTEYVFGKYEYNNLSD